MKQLIPLKYISFVTLGPRERQKAYCACAPKVTSYHFLTSLALLGYLSRTQIYLVCRSRTTRKAKTVLRMRTGSDVISRFNVLSVARQPPPNPKYISFVTLGPLERQKPYCACAPEVTSNHVLTALALLGNLPRTQIYLVCHSRTTRKAKTVLRMRTGSDVKSRFNSPSVARQPPPNPNISRLSL